MYLKYSGVVNCTAVLTNFKATVMEVIIKIQVSVVCHQQCSEQLDVVVVNIIPEH